MKLIWTGFAGSVCDDDHGCSGDNGGSPPKKNPKLGTLGVIRSLFPQTLGF